MANENHKQLLRFGSEQLVNKKSNQLTMKTTGKDRGRKTEKSRALLLDIRWLLISKDDIDMNSSRLITSRIKVLLIFKVALSTFHLIN